MRDRILAGLPAARAIAERTLAFFKTVLDKFAEEIANFGSAPTMYAGLVDDAGGLAVVRRPAEVQGRRTEPSVAADIRARDYAHFIGEASLRDSYLKAPYFKPVGYPAGVYRVGPLARLNVADALRHAATPTASWPSSASAAAPRRTARSTTTTRA